jgi:hypothetical protein
MRVKPARNAFAGAGRIIHHIQWQYPADTLVHLTTPSVAAIRDLCPPAGELRFFQQVSILGAAVGPVSLALTCLLEHPDDRLYRREF